MCHPFTASSDHPSVSQLPAIGLLSSARISICTASSSHWLQQPKTRRRVWWPSSSSAAAHPHTHHEPPSNLQERISHTHHHCLSLLAPIHPSTQASPASPPTHRLARFLRWRPHPCPRPTLSRPTRGLVLLGDALPLHPPRDPSCCFCSHHRLHLFTPLLLPALRLLALALQEACFYWEDFGSKHQERDRLLSPFRRSFSCVSGVLSRYCIVLLRYCWVAACLISIVLVRLLLRRVSPGFCVTCAFL